MGIFNKEYGSVTAPVYEGYGAETNGCNDILIESFEDELAVIEAMHALDMIEIAGAKRKIALEAADADADEIEASEKETEELMEGAIRNVYDKIIEGLKTLWGKIKAFFASAIRFLDSIFMSASGFIKKYEKQLNQLQDSGKLKGFKYEKFNYTLSKFEYPKEAMLTPTEIHDLDAKLKRNDLETLKGELDTDDEAEKFKDELRGASVGKQSVTSDDYADELFKFFRDGKSDKTEVTISIKDIIADIKTASKSSAEIKSISSTVDTLFNKCIANVKRAGEKIERDIVDVERKTVGTQLIKQNVSEVKAAQSITLQYISAYKTAVNESLNVGKSVCLAAFRYKADK